MLNWTNLISLIRYKNEYFFLAKFYIVSDLTFRRFSILSLRTELYDYIYQIQLFGNVGCGWIILNKSNVEFAHGLTKETDNYKIPNFLIKFCLVILI